MSEAPNFDTKSDDPTVGTAGIIVSTAGINEYPKPLLTQAIERREAAKEVARRAETVESGIPEIDQPVVVTELQHELLIDPPSQAGGTHGVPNQIRHNLPQS